jgi:hypothetical protein
MDQVESFDRGKSPGVLIVDRWCGSDRTNSSRNRRKRLGSSVALVPATARNRRHKPRASPNLELAIAGEMPSLPERFSIVATDHFVKTGNAAIIAD